MMKALFLLIFCFPFFSLNAQSNFQNVMGNSGNFYQINSMTRGPQGHYYIAGVTNSSSVQKKDGILVILNDSGLKISTADFGNSGNDELFTIKFLSDGRYAMVGSTESFTSGSSDTSNIFFIIMEGQGLSINKMKCPGTIFKEEGRDFTETFDHQFVISGSIELPGRGKDVFVIKLDSTGQPLWGIAYGTSIYNEVANSIIETPDHGYMVAGYSFGFSVYKYPYLLKINENGAVQWANSYSFNTAVTPDRYFNKIIYGYNNDYILAGTDGTGSVGAREQFLLSVDGSGNSNWMKRYTLNANAGEGKDVAKSADGGFILGGTMGINYASLVKTDSVGNYQWSMIYPELGAGFNSQGNAVVSLSDSSFALGGAMIAGDTLAYLVKTDLNGVTNCHSEFLQFAISSPLIASVLINTLPDTMMLSLNNPFAATLDSLIWFNTNLCALTDVANTEIKVGTVNCLVVHSYLQFSLVGTGDEIEKIKCFDLMGRNRATNEWPKNEIDVSSWTPGIYIYKLKTKSGSIFNGKFYISK